MQIMHHLYLLVFLLPSFVIMLLAGIFFYNKTKDTNQSSTFFNGWFNDKGFTDDKTK